MGNILGKGKPNEQEELMRWISDSWLASKDKHHAARLYEALLAESIDEIAILTRLFSEGKLSTDFLDKLCDMANVGLGAQHQVKTDLLRALQKLTDECDQRLGASMAGGSAAPAVVVPPKELVRVLSKYCQSLPGEKMNAAGLGKFYGEYPELKSNDVRIKTLCQDHPSLLTWIDDDTAHGKGWICAASRPPLPLKGDRKYLFCDGSNIIIEFQKDPVTGRHRDHVLLSPSRLLQLVSDGGSTVEQAIVVGSYAKTPSVKWETWEQAGWKHRLLQKVNGKEQAVDDILHCPMYQLLADPSLSFAEPRTLVLLTGDGNDNDGRTTFLDVVQKALLHNVHGLKWRVHLWAWKAGLNSEYKKLLKDPNFKIYYLDDYREELNETSVYIERYVAPHGVRLSKDEVFRCNVPPGSNGPPVFDRALAFFANTHALRKFEACLTTVDERLVFAGVKITKGSPSYVSIVGNLDGVSADIRRDIKSRGTKNIGEVFASIVEAPAFDLPGVSPAEIKADALPIALKTAMSKNEVSFYPILGPLIKIILCSFKDNESGRNKVKELFLQLARILDRTTKVVEVQGRCQVTLFKRRWSAIEAATLLAAGKGVLSLEVKWPAATVALSEEDASSVTALITVSGSVHVVNEASRILTERVSSIQVREIKISPSNSWKQGLHIGLENRIKSLLDGACDSTAVGLYRLDLTTVSVVLEPAKKEDLGKNNVIKVWVAYFSDDSDLEGVHVFGLLTELTKNYDEEKCLFEHFLPTHNRKDPLFRSKVKKDMLLFEAFFVQNAPQPYVLLCGPENHVKTAYTWLTTTPDGEKKITVAVHAPSRFAADLLRSTYHSDTKERLMLMAGVNAVAESLSADRKAADDLSVFQIKGRNDRLEPIAKIIDHAIAEWAKTLLGRPLLERLKPLDGFGNDALSRYLKSSAEGEVMLKNLQDARGVCIFTSSMESAPLAGPSITGAPAGPNASFFAASTAAVELWCGTVGDLELSVCHGNIVTHPTKAIVNAANEKLDHRGGVALAIANAAGRHLVYECEDIVQASGNVPVGSAVVTGAYNLRGMDCVIHAVGPIYDYRGMSWDALYRKTIICALRQANDAGATSVSIPLLGCGIFRWPHELAAKLMVMAVAEFTGTCSNRAVTLKRVTLIDMDERSVSAMVTAVQAFERDGPPSTLPKGHSQPLVPMKPTNVYSFYQHEKKCWTMYDYDQNYQIEMSHQFPVYLHSDIRGVPSISKFIPDDEKYARYLVHRENNTDINPRCLIDGVLYSFYQENVVSKFKRPVKCEAFHPSRHHHMFGLPESALAHVPVSVAAEAPTYAMISTKVRAPSAAATGTLPDNWTVFQQPGTDVVCYVNTLTKELSWIRPVDVEDIAPASLSAAAGDVGAVGELRVLGLADDVQQVQDEIVDKLKNSIKTAKLEKEACGRTDLAEVECSLRKMFEENGLAIDVDVTVHNDSRVVVYKTLGDATERKVERLVRGYLLKLIKDNQVKYPAEWSSDGDHDPTEEFKYVDLVPGSQAFLFAKGQFEEGGFIKEIEKIQLVQNYLAYEAFYNKSKLLSNRNKSAPADATMEERANQRWMKHATGITDPDVIARCPEGLDFRYCREGMFGIAAYTAELSEYSHLKEYRHELADGIHAQMFLVRVAAGRIFEVETYDEKYKKDVKPPEGFDSVRGPVRGEFKALMVYNTDQAYPAYLITYKK